MSLAVRIDVPASTGSRQLAAVTWALASAALGLMAWQIGSGPSLVLPDPEATRFGFAVLPALLCVCAAVKALRAALALDDPAPDQSGELVVDQAGAVLWQARDWARALPMTVRSVTRLPGLILLVLAPDTSLAVRSARSAKTVLAVSIQDLAPHDWRRLNRWLLWIQRG